MAKHRSEQGLRTDLDFIEELRLRRWARENYVPSEKRSKKWHPVVHEEMKKEDLWRQTRTEPLTVYLDPGSAPQELISDFYVALAVLHRSLGGSGLEIVNDQFRCVVGEEVTV